MAAPANYRTTEMSLPGNYWNHLSQEDKAEFQLLRNHFHQSQKVPTKDRRLVSFANELTTILKYIEHSEEGRENRTILAGVAFGGPFVCVNTRQLKNFLGRCKSSINGSFQQLGYVAVRTKTKARQCVLAILPSLVNDQNILRQWTVRYACDTAQFCFRTMVPSLQLPKIADDDLNDDHHISRPPTVIFPERSTALPSALPIRSLSQGLMGAIPDLQIDLNANDIAWSQAAPADISTSYSVESFSLIGQWEEDSPMAREWTDFDGNHGVMRRSQSAYFPEDRGSFLGDFSLF